MLEFKHSRLQLLRSSVGRLAGWRRRHAVGGAPAAGEGFLGSFGQRDRTKFDEFYSAGATLYTPLTGPVRGRDAIWEYFSELHRAFPALRVTLHDEFGSADGGRSCIRIHLGWQN